MAADVTGLAAGYSMPVPALDPAGGPGTELALLLTAAGIDAQHLQREGRVRQMDHWDADGCKRRRKEIVGWLRAEHEKKAWATRVTHAARMAAAATGSSLSAVRILPDPFNALVGEAIRRAEERLAPLASHGEFAAHALAPRRLHRLDHRTLEPAVPGQRFNASVLRVEGRTLLAWRDRQINARVFISELGPGFLPTGRTALLDLDHHFANAGKDDPRLFVFEGRLHVAYTGVHLLEQMTAHVMYAELDDSLEVRRVYMPDYRDRVDWEKNWGFFESDGHLHAVYSIRPHRVLTVDGSTAVLAHETAWSSPWRGGLLRGGSPPFRVGDEFYCFFHGTCEIDDVRTYTAGVYTFEANAPFRVKRCTRWPVATPDPATKPRRIRQNIMFPCGAFLDGERWIVSCGVHDSWIEISEFDAADIEKRLEAVA